MYGAFFQGIWKRHDGDHQMVACETSVGSVYVVFREWTSSQAQFLSLPLASRIFSALTLCLPLGYSSNYIVFLTQLWQLPGPHTANPWRPVFHSAHAVTLLALQQFSYLYASHTHCLITFLTSSMALPPLKWELMVLSVSLDIHPAACKNVWVWMTQRCSKSWKFNQHNIITQI